jgi:diguanylate cyclase (GGDEF)-like protein
MVVKDIGIALGQGYFIARPSPTPALVPAPEVSRVISSSQIAVFPKATLTGRRHTTSQKLLTYVEPVQPDTMNETVFERFTADPALRVVPVVRNGLPIGLINRYNFIDRFAKPYQRELFGKKPCIKAMQAEPLLVSKDMPIEELSHFLADAEGRHFSDGFIITEEGRYVGLASGQDLLRELTKMQLEAARYANPLTLLPGNVPINEHIERLMLAETPFVICYADLDHFKPFNDVYSYRKGDEMIQLAGRILGLACDPRMDFIGHIGGDDFILLMQSTDWKKRCNDALQSFAQMSVSLVREEHRRMGGYESEDRNGKIIFHPLTTLSIGAVRVEPGQFESHYEVSAAATVAKRMAKQMPGNSLFCEARQHGNGRDTGVRRSANPGLEHCP